MSWHADLHSHTLASDGTLTPDALVAWAAECDVRVLAVTDHDTVAGLGAAVTAGRSLGVEVVAGIEISAWAGRELHILGLFIDSSDDALCRAMALRAVARRERVLEIGARLQALGAPIDAEAVLLDAARQGSNVGRPHVARALIAAGHVRDFDEAFRRFLGRDGPANVPASHLPTRDAIDLIHGAGGLASLAHPGIEGVDEKIATLADEGLDALELRHPAHGKEDVSRYAGLAAVLSLLTTGGADVHGPHGTAKPGDFGVSAETLAQLSDRARRGRVLAPAINPG